MRNRYTALVVCVCLGLLSAGDAVAQQLTARTLTRLAPDAEHYAGPEAAQVTSADDAFSYLSEGETAETSAAPAQTPFAALQGSCTVYTNKELRQLKDEGLLTVSGGTASITIPADACPIPKLTFSTYALPGGDIRPFNEQVLVDAETQEHLQPGQTYTFEADLPEGCSTYQSDLYFGHPIAQLHKDYGHPGDLIIWWDYVEGEPCGPDGDDQVCIEAEDGELGRKWAVENDGSASGGSYIVYDGSPSYDDVPGSSGRATYAFDVSETGVYAVYGRFIAPDGDSNSFWVRVDDGPWFKWNDIDADDWAWGQVYDQDNADQPLFAYLEAGSHEVTVAYREPGARLDKLVVSSKPEAPTNADDGCGEPSEPPCFTSTTECLTLGIIERENLADGSAIIRLSLSADDCDYGVSNVAFQIPDGASVMDLTTSSAVTDVDVNSNGANDPDYDFIKYELADDRLKDGETITFAFKISGNTTYPGGELLAQAKLGRKLIHLAIQDSCEVCTDETAPEITIGEPDLDGVFVVTITDETGIQGFNIASAVNATLIDDGGFTPGDGSATLTFQLDDPAMDYEIEVEASDECNTASASSAGEGPCKDNTPPTVAFDFSDPRFVVVNIADDQRIDRIDYTLIDVADPSADPNLELVDDGECEPGEATATCTFRLENFEDDTIVEFEVEDNCNAIICDDDEAPLVTTELVVRPPDANGQSFFGIDGAVTDNVGIQSMTFFRLNNVAVTSSTFDGSGTQQAVSFEIDLIDKFQSGSFGLVAADECNAYVLDPIVDGGEADEEADAEEADDTGDDRTAEAIYVNFQTADTDTPDGYLADTGDKFGNRGNGQRYGWLRKANRETRNRNAGDDTRYGTLNHLQKRGQRRVWEIKVPNGTYDVFLVAGDPSHTDQRNDFDVEGQRLRDRDGWDHFDEYTTTVDVEDGRLTIKPHRRARNAKIAFVHITPVGGGVAAGLVASADEQRAASAAAAFATATPELPDAFELQGNYPNPFNPSTTIQYALPEQAQVRLAVYDLMGRRVALLVDGQVGAGRHEVRFDAGRLASGVYLYRLETPQGTFIKQMMLMK